MLAEVKSASETLSPYGSGSGGGIRGEMTGGSHGREGRAERLQGSEFRGSEPRAAMGHLSWTHIQL